MSTMLAEWHAARNALVADEHADRARRFGLRLLARRLREPASGDRQPDGPDHLGLATGETNAGRSG